MTLITNKCLLSTAGAVSVYSVCVTVCVCLFVVRTTQANGLRIFIVEKDHTDVVSSMKTFCQQSRNVQWIISQNSQHIFFLKG